MNGLPLHHLGKVRVPHIGPRDPLFELTTSLQRAKCGQWRVPLSSTFAGSGPLIEEGWEPPDFSPKTRATVEAPDFSPGNKSQEKPGASSPCGETLLTSKHRHLPHIGRRGLAFPPTTYADHTQHRQARQRGSRHEHALRIGPQVRGIYQKALAGHLG